MTNLKFNNFSLFLKRIVGQKVKILIFLTLIAIGLIYKFYDINIIYIVYIILSNPSCIFMKYLCLISMLFGLIMISRYILFNVSLYLVKNKKLSKSAFKPFFINNFIGELEEIIHINDLEFFVDYYYRLLFFYLFFFIFILLNYIYMYT